MRVIADLDPSTYERIEKFVRQGDYDDVGQFLRVAVQNQISIEQNGKQQSSQGQRSEPQSDSIEWVYEVPEHPPIAEPYSFDRSEILLFQQYYRFFPLIPALVELAKVTSSHEGPAELTEFREHMRQQIKPLRNEIQSWENKNDIKKQNRKSTGLPKTDVKNPEYSMKRYLDHFVGKVRQRDHQPQSFGNSLGLISYKPQDNGTCLLQLTKAGKQFIQIGNPLLDQGPDQRTLSPEESTFLVRQINTLLPEEFRFMESVYDILEKNGNETYTNSLNEFRDFLMASPGFDDEDPSEDRIRSITAGALSRMVELDIVDRGNKRGVYVPKMRPSSFLDDTATI